MVQFIVLVLLLIVKDSAITTGQTCLSSPRAITHDANTANGDIEWNYISENTYGISIEYGAASVNIPIDSSSVDITTRLHNGSFPSPTIRFQRGNQYQVTLINSLGPESPSNPTEENVYKDPNTTNLHT